MNFKKKNDEKLKHITLRVQLSTWNKLKVLCNEHKWVRSDVGRYCLTKGIDLLMEEDKKQCKAAQVEMF